MTSTDTDAGSRNAVMGVAALLSAGLLVCAATGVYRTFSYLAAGFIVVVVGASSVERNESGWDLAPYNGLVLGLAAVFVVGLTGIWLLWSPGVTSYTYVLGLPTSTLVYVVFIWLLPILGAFYYALVFPDVGGAVADTIVDDAHDIQRTSDDSFPLAAGFAGTDGGARTNATEAGDGSSGRGSDDPADGGETR